MWRYKNTTSNYGATKWSHINFLLCSNWKTRVEFNAEFAIAGRLKFNSANASDGCKELPTDGNEVQKRIIACWICDAHRRNNLAYYARAPLSVVSRKQHRTCSQHRFKARIPHKTTSRLKLHNFVLCGGTQCHPTLKFCYDSYCHRCGVLLRLWRES